MTSSSRPVILICVGVYLPGYRGGGPIRSLSNLVENLSEAFDFRVLTLDNDVGSDTAYDGIRYGEWQDVGSAAVRYLSRSERLMPRVVRIVNETSCRVIYLNAVHPTPVSTPVLLARRFGLLSDVPVVVCPRGHLHPGALAQKPIRKAIYLRLAKALGLYRGVLWHATNEEEASHIRSHFGSDARIQIAPNLGVAPTDLDNQTAKSGPKEAGRLSAVFLSRIAPKKNLLGALRLLRQLEDEVHFDIYGPIGDEGYWSKCRQEMAKLPANIRAEYHGPVSHDRVFDIFGQYDLFFFPTFGENFGHVIFEALSSGCPALITDQTPWRNLRDHNAGWDLSLDSPQAFKEALHWCIEASEDEYQRLRAGARDLARTAIASPANVEKVRKLFERAVSE